MCRISLINSLMGLFVLFFGCLYVGLTQLTLSTPLRDLIILRVPHDTACCIRLLGYVVSPPLNSRAKFTVPLFFRVGSLATCLQLELFRVYTHFPWPKFKIFPSFLLISITKTPPAILSDFIVPSTTQLVINSVTLYGFSSSAYFFP